VLIFLIGLFLTQTVASQNGDFITFLNQEDFSELQREPLSAKYSEVEAVKLVYDLEKNQIYYLSSKWDYHNRFCLDVLGYEEGLAIFNRDNYGADTEARGYLLANINYFKNSNQYVLELSPTDLMPLELIEFLHAEVVKSSFLKADFKLLCNSSRLLSESSNLELNTISPEEIYRNQTYQAVSEFTGSGLLKRVKIEDLANAELSSSDIVILDGTPLFLSGVSGVISTDLQTPLSHLSILGQNRKVPVMALKSAWTDNALNDLVGKWVELKVSPSGYEIYEINKPQLELKANKRERLKYDLKKTDLVPIKSFDRKTSLYAGYKAENMGVLHKLSKELRFSVPEGAFCIPFYYYYEHIKSAGVLDLIEELNTNPENHKALLTQIRQEILNTSVNSELIENIYATSESLSTFTRLRFRSSTNAEDMKGFSGAGLYTSKTAILHSQEKSVESALLKVWASLWSEAAFKEREYFNFNHSDAMMGILVHRSFPNEEVNGVAITKNVYRKNAYGFVVNAQIGEVSVVQPDPNITCDQFICYPTKNSGLYSTNQTVELITTSSLNDYKPTMSNQEIAHLANVLDDIKRYFYYRDFTTLTFSEYGLDLEFKLDELTRDLYIKQVRPFNY